MKLRFALLAALAVGCSSSDFAISQSDAEAETSLVDSTIDDSSVDSRPADDDTATVADAPIADAPIADVPIGVCPPAGAELYVSPTGKNISPANGSVGCPFKTISRALLAATAVTTKIHLHKGKYGTVCDGGPPCDSSPIVVPITLSNGVIIAGQGLTSDVVVSGDGDTVFDVRAGGVGFESMTIEPKKLGLPEKGGHGITDWGPAVAGERAITKVEIRGTLAADGGMGTGAAINLRSAASPIIGPDVRLSKGTYGVWVQTTSRPRITGTPELPVKMTDFGGSCVRAAALPGADRPSVIIDSGTSTTPGVELASCGGTAAIVLDTAASVTSTIDKVIINKGFPGSGGIVVRQSHTLNASAVTITDAQGPGFYATDTAVMNIERSIVTNSGTYGLLYAANSKGNVSSVTSQGNLLDGIKCEGASKLILRSSTLVNNRGNGLLVAGACVADATTTVFNKTSMRNTAAGLCYLSTGAAPSALSSTWSCKRTLPGCVMGTAADVPSRGQSSSECVTNVDISEPTTVISAAAPSCCN